MEGLPRHPLYFKVVSFCLYAFGGLALFYNCGATAIAYQIGEVPLALAYILSGIYTCTSIGVGLYLGNPNEWGSLWTSFVATAKGATGGGQGKAPRELTAFLLALIISGIVGFVAVCYAADWQTTGDFLSSRGVTGFYLWAACLALILGPEVSFVLGHVALQQGKRQEIVYLLHEQQTRPQLEYLKTAVRGQTQTARQAAATDAKGFQHQ